MREILVEINEMRQKFKAVEIRQWRTFSNTLYYIIINMFKIYPYKYNL